MTRRLSKEQQVRDVARKLGPLTDIRVLDLTAVVMGPYCTQVMADLGADVVKVESPEGGDTSRYVGPSKTKGRAAMFTNLNRGKRSVALDLRSQEGRALCLRLAERADVVIHSMRKPAIERLGLDYKTISGVNRDVIYASLYGFGKDGRYSGKPAYDDTIQAISGLAMLQAEINPDPQYVTTVVGDKICALSAAYAIMAALFYRQRGGGGQEIEVPMFEVMASFLLVEHIAGAVYDPPMGRPVYSRAVARDRRPYKTKDGFLSVLVYNDKQWQRFSGLAGRPELSSDERFCTQAARSSNMTELCATVAQILAGRTSAEWLYLLEDAEIPVARLNSTQDLYDDPHLKDVGFFKSIDDPIDGVLRLPDHPVRFSRSPASFNCAGPMLGEHTRSVLLELGLSDAEVKGLEARGVIRCWRTRTGSEA